MSTEFRSYLHKSLVTILLLISLSGCAVWRSVVGVHIYGSPGYAFPGTNQYVLFLKDARAGSKLIDEYCVKMGAEPAVIKIGNSGRAQFMWKNSHEMIQYNAQNFNAKIVNQIPKDLLPYASDNVKAQIAEKAKVAAKRAPQPRAQAVVKNEISRKEVKEEAKYKVRLLERIEGDDFAYRFALEYPDGADLRTFRRNNNEIRELVVEEYSQFRMVDPNTVKVGFPSNKMHDNIIEGVAIVFEVKGLSLEYDPNTREGVFSVKICAGEFEKTRNWVRHNIEAIACDKNIRLVTGERPPTGRFYLLRETVKDNNVLEVQFRTE